MSKLPVRFIPYGSSGSHPLQTSKPEYKQSLVKDSGLAQLKTREICRVIYPLNNSGSKQVIVGLDPAADFQPVITLGKPGWSGFRMSLESFTELSTVIPYINDYFKNPSEQLPSIHLSAIDDIEFRRGWGRPVICITNKIDGSVKVSLAQTSWEGLVKLMPLLALVTSNFTASQADALAVFVGLSQRLKACLPDPVLEALPIIDNEKMFHDILESITWDSISYTSRPDTTLNLELCFLELKAFCVEHLASYIPFV